MTFGRPYLLSLVALFGACSATPPPEPRPLVAEEATLVQAASAAADAGAPSAAVRVRELIERFPESVDGRRLEQRLRLAAGESWQVYEDAREAHLRRPDDAASLYLLARVIPDPEIQAEMFERAARLDPGFYWARYGLAVVSLETGDVDRALDSAEAALAIRPGDVDARLIRGRALDAAGETEPALDELLAIAEEHPGHVRAALAAAESLGRAGREDAALYVVLRALEAGGTATALLAEAWSLTEPDVAPAALELLRSAAEGAVAAEPNSPHARLLLARALELDGEYARALAEIERAIAAGALPARHREMRIALAIKAGDYPAAKRAWAEVHGPHVLRRLGGRLPDRLVRLGSAFERATVRSEDPDALADLARALSAAGFEEAASLVGARALSRDPGRSDLQTLVGDLLAWERFLSGVRDVFRRGYRASGAPGQPPGDLAKAKKRIAALSRTHLGRDVLSGLVSISLPLVGEVARTDPRAADGAWAAHGTLLVLGQRVSSPPEAVLARVIDQVSMTDPEYTLVLAEGVSLRSLIEAGGANIAGFTLPGWVFLNVDVADRWEQSILRLAKRAEDRPLWPAANEERRRSLWFPAGVRARLARRYAAEAHEGNVTFDSSLAHEVGHVIDVEGYLPLLPNLPSVLAELVGHGFSARAIEAGLERTAETYALLHSPSAWNALVNTTGFLPYAGSNPPHSVGYFEIVEALVETIDEHPDRYPSIDRGYNVLQQLDRLSERELRDLLDRTLR